MRRLGALVALVPLVAAPLALSGASWAAISQSFTKAISRVHLVDGKDVIADSRTFHVTVGETTNLRDRQSVRVSWTGAHPTNLAVTDPNTEAASEQEYPVVILQCRGLDDPKLPLAKQARPETCWTQTPSERFFLAGEAYPPWRVDRYASPAQRAADVGLPTPLPAHCSPLVYQQRWLHFVGVNGTDYPGGLGGCGGLPAESSFIDSKQAMPPNTTYGTSDAQGSGEAKFNVWTSQTNASLGCSDKVACSLEIIPIEGVSCDVAALGLPADQRPTGDDATKATSACQDAGGGAFAQPAVQGKLWWTGSNWRNRVSVPLQFNPLPGTCGLSSGDNSAVVYGSELLVQATQSWGTTFCNSSKLFPFRHVQVGEPQARNLLATGSVDAAFTTDPPGTENPAPLVVAPTALTGFAISYAVDDASGREYRSLRLTPRLLAKLLTMSYPTVVAEKQENPGLANNPLNMSLDPEFQALNPGVKHGVDSAESAATLYALSSDSDVMEALTAYIDADPEARAWLDGAPDAWGMTVNPAYKGVTLPVNSWPLLDTFEPPSIYNGSNLCLQANPVPFLPLIAAPTSRLVTIGLAMQFAIAPSQLICQVPPNGDANGAKLVALGRQTIGSRFMIGVTSLADARRYDLDTAALQTRVTGAASPSFATTTGRSFVEPTPAGLKAAAVLLAPDAKHGTWRLPYEKLTGVDGSTSAYPGTMLVSALVPTSGLPPAVAHRYATLLRYIAGPGQVPGPVLGELPDGYLPLTTSNGLGALSGFTLRAADAVAAQSGAVVPLAPPAPTPAATLSSTPAPEPSTSVSSGSAVSGSVSTAAGPPPASPVLARVPAPAPALASTDAPSSGAGGSVLVAMVEVALVTGLGAAAATTALRRSGS